MIVSSIWRRFKKNDEKPNKKSSFYTSIYPDTIRYALQYKSAQMGKTEIVSLLHRYVHEAVYLVTKALVSKREYQRQFIEKLSQIYITPDWTENDLRDLIAEYIVYLPDNVSIDGAKLAQLNRIGAINFKEAFRNLALQCRDVDYDKFPVVVAHTPLIAFHHFIEIFSQLPIPKFLLLVPAWMEDKEDPYMGYEIKLEAQPSVTFQEKDECIFGEWVCKKLECRLRNKYCGNCVFIDDTIKTATTAGKVRSFWETEYGNKISDDRIRVITDLRNKTTILF